MIRLLLALLLLLSSCTSASHYREVPIPSGEAIWERQIEDVNRRLCLERGGMWQEQANRCVERP